MIIAGPCLYVDHTERQKVIDTARELSGVADIYRCKLWGGGTTPEKWCAGIGNKGLETLRYIELEHLPTMTEVQSLNQLMAIGNLALSAFWIGARNASNYAFIQEAPRYWKRAVYVKRPANMTIAELVGLYDIYNTFFSGGVYIIERGINTFDRQALSRWAPDLRGAIELKHSRPDIFARLIIDCSHSTGRAEWVEDTYKSFKALGILHYMFECTIDGVSLTDSNQIISTDKLKEILK